MVHCNLKPSNIVIDQNRDLRITNFSHARIQGTKITEPFSDIQCYCSPELLLGGRTYEFAIDMWSVGYMFAEMLNREPFFLEDRNINPLHLIVKDIDDRNVRIYDKLLLSNLAR
jgi:serine/threonine protein kinase